MCGLHMELVLCDFIPELILTQYIDTSTCPGTVSETMEYMIFQYFYLQV